VSSHVSYSCVPPSLQLTYSETMTAIFVEGWIFIVLSITGVRGGLVKFMPKNVAMASSGNTKKKGAARRMCAVLWVCLL